MYDVAIGLLSILVGSLVIIFRDPYVRTVARWQASIGFHDGEREYSGAKVVAVIVGTGFVIIGHLAIVGVIQFEQ